jgi:pyrroloquinoline-quinone synthase
MPSQKTSTPDLWAQIEEEMKKYDLLTHPFYQAWTEGKLTHRELAFYGWQYLHHVAAFPTYLTALHARLPEGVARQAVLRNAADEEVDGLSHAELWRQFIGGMEPVQRTESEEILPEIRQLVDGYRHLASRDSLPTVLGAFYAYESQVPVIAETKLAGLKQFYGAGHSACEYFTLHATADLHHAKVWRKLIDRCLQENPACAADVLNGVNRGAKALWRALDGIEAARHSLVPVN